jgi:hypothetical protein
MSHESSALVPDNYDKLPREAKKTADSTFDRIYKYFFNSKTRIELSVEEQRISERWERAWLFLCRHRTRKQVADLLMRQFNVSKSLAFDDVKNAMHLFGEPQEGQKNAKRAIAEDAILKGMDRAWKMGDMKMHEKYTQQYIELNGLKNEDVANIEDMIRKLIPPAVTLVTNMEVLKAAAKKIQDDLVQDIPYEDIDGKESD